MVLTEERVEQIRVQLDVDILTARGSGRTLAKEIGFSMTDQALIATAISELSRNILVYAGLGDVIIRIVSGATSPGIEVTATDEGPGIEDIDAVMRDGYSTVNTLGLGLPGTKRIMDEFSIESTLGEGTTVIALKWVRR